MAHDVFISYPNDDKVIADAICATLESRHVRCWIAPRDILPGTNYAEALVTAIDTSKIMILVFSERSNKSPHILREVERAVKKDLIIIPFRIENVEPSMSMQYYIGAPHWLDALTPPLEKHLARLADAVVFLIAQKNGVVITGEGKDVTPPSAGLSVAPEAPSSRSADERPVSRSQDQSRAQIASDLPPQPLDQQPAPADASRAAAEPPVQVPPPRREPSGPPRESEKRDVAGDSTAYRPTNADFGRRILAYFVDQSIVIVILYIIGLDVLVILAFYPLYFAGMELSSARSTLGKMLMNLKVVNAEGAAISVPSAILRSLVKIPLFSILGLSMLFNKDRWAFYDRLMGSLVVRKD